MLNRIFKRGLILEEHKMHGKGVNKRPIKVVMPEKGKNTLSFINYKQMKAPFVIYADFEALIKNIQGFQPGKTGSYTEKKKQNCTRLVVMLTQLSGAR